MNNELLPSIIGGVLVGFLLIKFSSHLDLGFSNKIKKNDDVVEKNQNETAIKLNADAVLKKCASMHHTLGITDEEIRKAVDDVNNAKYGTGSDADDGINWVKILEYVLLLGAFVGFLMWANIESKGEVVYWLSVYFPSEMQTLGFKPAGHYARRPK